MLPANLRMLQSAVHAKKNTNFLQPNEFRLVFHRTPNLVYFCQSIKIPAVSLSNATQPSPFATPISIPTSKLEFQFLEITFPISEDMKNWSEIYNWMTAIPPTRDYSGITEYKEIYSDATLVLLNSASRPFLKIDFINCFPVLLSDVTLSTTVTDILPIMCEAEFRYTGYKVEYIDKSLESLP